MANGNPFHYGTPAEHEHFTGREEEIDTLLSRMRNQISVVLLSPRRYGKTSLLRRAQSELAGDRPAPAVIDVNVLRCRDIATLVGRLTSAAYHLPGGRWHQVKQAVPEFLRRIRIVPSVTFGEDGRPTFGFGPSLAPQDADDILAAVYALLAEQAESRPAVLILDEFQAITRHGAHLPDLLKALADEHPHVVLVVAGSKRHMMERLVVSKEAPLYGMAQKLALGPIPDNVMAAHLTERAAAGGKQLDAGVAARIIDLAGPVPNDIQRLAFETFNLSGRRIAVSDVDRGLEAAVSHEAAQYAERFADVSEAQGSVLAGLAVASAPKVFSAAFARSAGLASGASVRRALDALEAKELVVERDGRWVVADPFFASWLVAAAT